MPAEYPILEQLAYGRRPKYGTVTQMLRWDRHARLARKLLVAQRPAVAGTGRAAATLDESTRRPT